MANPGSRRTAAALTLLVIVCAPVFLYGLGRPALTDPDEGRNATVAREMMTGKSWVTPLFNGARYLDKPPVFFWTIAASYFVFGVSEFSARLPSAVFALCGITLTAWFARRYAGPVAGWLSGIMLALTPIYIVFGRTVIFDMMLAFFMTSCALAAFEAMEGEGRASRFAAAVFFAAAGVGTIVKGPVALVAPLVVAVVWALLRGKPSLLGRLRWGSGLVIYAAIVTPWVALIAVRNPGYLEYALLGENLGRIATDHFDRARPFHYYTKILMTGFFPWVLYALSFIALRVASLRHRPSGAGSRVRLDRLVRERLGDVMRGGSGGGKVAVYSAVWLMVLCLFFTILAAKRAAYILPCAIPIALITGVLWTAVIGEGRGRRRGEPIGATTDPAWSAVAGRVLTLGTILVAIACAVLAVVFAALGPLGIGSAVLGDRYDEFLGRSGLFGLTALGVALTGLGVFSLRSLRRPIATIAVVALTIPIMTPVARAASQFIDDHRTVRGMARFLADRLEPGDRVIFYEHYRPGLNFYLGREFDQVTPDGRVFTSNYIKLNLDRFVGDPSFRLMPENTMWRLLRDGVSQVFIIAPPEHYDDVVKGSGVQVRLIYEDRSSGIFVKQRRDE